MARLLINGVNKGNIRIRDIKTECFGIDKNSRIYLYFSDNEKILIPFRNKPESFNDLERIALSIRNFFKEYPYFVYEIHVSLLDVDNIEIHMFQDNYGVLECHRLTWNAIDLTLRKLTKPYDGTDIQELEVDENDYERAKSNRRAILVQDIRNKFTSQNNCLYATQYIHECDYVDRNDFYVRLTGAFLKIEFGSMIHINKYVVDKEGYNNCINDIREFICEDDNKNLIGVEMYNQLNPHNYIEIVFRYESSDGFKYYKTLKFGDTGIMITKSPTFDVHHTKLGS